MSPPIQARLGAAVARLRRKAGYSQESFANHLGVHRVYMGCVERGERDFRVSTLERLATALGLTTTQLVREAEKQTPNGGQK